jgi:hypothetical protein
MNDSWPPVFLVAWNVALLADTNGEWAFRTYDESAFCRMDVNW